MVRRVLSSEGEDANFMEEQDSRSYARNGKARNTERAYASDWKDFEKFCARRNKATLPSDPDDVALYLRNLAQKRKLKITTVARRLASIAETHKAGGYKSPSDEWVVKNTLKRLRRELGEPAKGKSPLVTADIARIMSIVPETLVGDRDRALLLLGFAGAMRRHELVSIDLKDLALAPEGLVVAILKGKTDQTRQGRKIGIPYGKNILTCPVRAVLKWIESAHLMDGPLFRSINKHGHIGMNPLSDQVVATIVKTYARRIGKYSSRFSGHSLRVGFVTSAVIAGVPERVIQNQTGHKSVLVLRRYIRDASIFRFNAAAKIGL